MPKPKSGKQTVNCNVLSCAHNCDCGCMLGSINIEPSCNAHSGNCEDESLCASYQCRTC